MQKINEMRMTLDSKSVNESFARSTVAAFMAQLDPTLDEISDVKMAVSEAVTNCIVHAYPQSVGKIYICVTVFENRRVRISIRDKGCGIVDVKQAMEPLFTTKPEEDRSGMGFSFMEAFMDELHVTSKVGEGTTVRMRKKIGRGVRTGSEAGLDRSSNHLD